MGANSVVGILDGPSAEKAYRRAVEEARWEHGNDPYAGTIAQTYNFFLASTTPLLSYDAEQAAQALLDANKIGKGELVGMIPIAVPITTREVKVTVDTAGLDWDAKRKTIRDAVQGRLRTGEGVVSLDWGAPKTKTKVVVTTGQGPTKRRFAVVTEYGKTIRYEDSQAKARAWMVNEMNSPRPFAASYQHLGVRGEVVREDGSPLVSATRVTVKETVTARAVVGAPSAQAPTRWAYAGVFPC